jgi:hypothetical protein
MRRGVSFKNVVFVLAVGALALVFAVDALSRAMPADTSAPTAAPSGAAGQPRDVDMDALRRMLRQGHLSDREALHSRPADEPVPPDEDR